MKIALFHTTLPDPDRKPGGVEIAVHRLANALVAYTPNEVTVFSLTPPPPDASYNHHQLFSQRPYLAHSPILRLFVLPWMLNLLTFERYDVVHFHGDDWFYIRRTSPTVRTFHGSALEEARSASSLKRRLSQYLVYPLEHLSARLSTKHVAIGPNTGRIYDTSQLMNNGVDMGLFRPGQKTQHPSVLFVGTWQGRKRGRFLFNIFIDRILSEIPEATLLMVADRCEEHDQVIFVPRPTDEELAALYRKAWVFAYPSVYEGFGIPYIEAMASGTAVLCSPNDGASYVLDDGEYGLVCDDDRFGDELVHLLTDECQRHRFEARGLRRAVAFSWEQVALDHHALYRQTLNSAD